MMRVEQIMTRNVRTCGPGDSLSTAARIMWEADCGCVPVVETENGDARVVGVITDRDICMAAYTQGLPLAAIPVGSAMSRNVVACRTSDSVADTARLLQQHRIHRVPVLDDSGRLAGIVSVNDLARLAAGETGRKGIGYELTEMLASICEPRWVRTPPPAAAVATSTVRKSLPAQIAARQT